MVGVAFHRQFTADLAQRKMVHELMHALAGTSPPAEYSRTTGSSCASSEAKVVGPSPVRRCGIIAGVGVLGVMMVCRSKETDCDV